MMACGIAGAPTAITGGLVLEGWDREPAPGTVLVEDGRIAAIGRGADADDLAARAAEAVDAAGAVVMPGLVNAHHHAYGNALRGTENALPLELWSAFTVAHGRTLDAGLLRLAILLGAAEMLRAGVTAAIDHSPQLGLHATVLAAHRESGMRVGYAPFMHDVHDHDFLGLAPPPALRAFLEAPGFLPAATVEAAIRSLAAETRSDQTVMLLLGPNAPQRCSDVLLDLWVRLRDELGLGVHTHLLETRAQAEGARRAWPHGLVREMDRRGLLAPGLSVAHGVWLDAGERALLGERGVVLAHNPASNLMLGSGLAPLQGYRRAGVTVALGSDSANSGGSANLFEVMRLAMMLPRLGDGWQEWIRAPEVLRMATEGGAAALGLGGRAGRIAPGFLADLVLVDVAGAALAAARPSVAALVQHAGPAQVRATMVGGRWAYRDGRILAFDEQAMLAAFTDRVAAAMAAADAGVALARAWTVA